MCVLRMYVCEIIHVCMYACMYVCTHVCTIYTRMCVCMYLGMYVCVYVLCMCVCTHVCMNVRMYAGKQPAPVIWKIPCIMNCDEISKSRIFKAERMAENIRKLGEGWWDE